MTSKENLGNATLDVLQLANLTCNVNCADLATGQL